MSAGERFAIFSSRGNVFERRTSTGSGLFSFVDGSFDQIFLQIVSIIVKSLRNTNLVAPRRFKMKKDLTSGGRASLKFLLFQLRMSLFSCIV